MQGFTNNARFRYFQTANQIIYPRMLPLMLATSLALSGAGIALMGWEIPVQAVATNVQSLINQGVAQYNKGYIKNALSPFQRATDLAPDNESAQLWYAKALYKQGGSANIEKAKAALTRVVTINPDNPEALVMLGEILSWDASTHANAIPLLQRAVDAHAGDAVVAKQYAKLNKTLAQLLIWKEQYQASIPYVERVGHQFDKDPVWMESVALLLLKTGHPQEAIGVYEDHLKPMNAPSGKNGGKNNDLKLSYAWALYEAGQQDAAKAVYQRLRDEAMQGNASSNTSLGFRQGLSALAYRLGEYEESLAIDQSLPDDVKQNTEVQLRMARALAKSFRVPEAVDIFQGLYERGQLSSQQKFEYADYLNSLQLPTEALPAPDIVERLYNEVLAELSPKGPIYLRLARYLNRQPGRYADALKAYVAAYQSGDAQIGASDERPVVEEMIDFLRSTPPDQKALARNTFEQLMHQGSDDATAQMQVSGAYAEFLSWQEDTRPEALKIYLGLVRQSGELPPEATQSDDTASSRSFWKGLNDTLSWHRPSPSLASLYEEVLALDPDNRYALLSLAKAYGNDPEYYDKAVAVYQDLKERYPNDPQIAKEWVELLTLNEDRRGEAIRTLKGEVKNNPDDMASQLAYGKLLSYRHRFRDALDAFEKVLAAQPDNKEALVGKGLTMLWSGHKFEAREFLRNVREQYPQDIDAALALAQAESSIGRRDKAIKILDEIRPLLNVLPQPEYIQQPTRFANVLDQLPKSALTLDVATSAVQSMHSVDELIPVVNRHQNDVRHLAEASMDFSILPFDSPGDHASPSQRSNVTPQQAPARTPETVFGDSLKPKTELTRPTQLAAPLKDVTRDVNDLHAAIDQLENLQQQSSTQLESVRGNLWQMKEAIPDTVEITTEADLHQPDNTATQTHRVWRSASQQPATQLNNPSGFAMLATSAATSVPADQTEEEPLTSGFGEWALQEAYGQQLNTLYDERRGTNDLLFSRGRFVHPGYEGMAGAVNKSMRPELHTGYLFSTQKGEPTTSALNYWGFHNQLSLSMTPQLRIRGGISPTRYYLRTSATRPRATWGTTYSWGATWQPTDRLELDGDMGITHYTQSGEENITYKAQAKYTFNDYVTWKVGSRRFPLENSLLSMTGFRATRGRYAGDFLGLVNETTAFTELNIMPFTNADINLGYEFGVDTGSHVPNNHKNQFFGSAGYKYHINENHSARLSYEFFWMGYDKNATNGYFDLSSDGNQRRPLAVLNPIVRAHGGYVFGGYFSPNWFVTNALRLDLEGNFFHRFLEYDVGGSIGIQAYDHGHDISDSDPTSLMSAFNARITTNFTDWLAAYGMVDYLNTGGYNRWRYGGGLVLRPNIPALGPIFGKRASTLDANKRADGAPVSSTSAIMSNSADIDTSDLP